jgi:ubiquinone/menaquinone biosynthesis C-methylase UbiE
MSNYIKALKIDRDTSQKYYESSLHKKTEQQKFLEKLLIERSIKPKFIADIACGGGGSTLYLHDHFPHAKYTLIDANEDAMCLAEKSTKHIDAKYIVGDIYDLPLQKNTYDIVICWQTLSWLDKPDVALKQLVRICKPGGRIYASSLFNFDADVDIYSKVVDHTRVSSSDGITVEYNTYSIHSLNTWVSDMITEMQVHKFTIPIDLKYNGRGLGTSTIKLENGERIQTSAGMLLNWGVLEIVK